MQKKLITVANLGEALNAEVRLPATVGTHIGRGFKEFPLESMDYSMLGNDKFTEVYFVTSSGNLYRIGGELGVGADHRHWILTDVKTYAGHPLNAGYLFPEDEFQKAVLKVGQRFFFCGGHGRTTAIAAILAVNASRCYTTPPPDTTLESNIRNEFLTRMGWK